jgi:Uma2 family endonuclease
MESTVNDLEKVGRATAAVAGNSKPQQLMPLLFEDEGLEMGEAEAHKQTTDIIYYGLEFHFSRAGCFRVFSDLNLYYDPDDPAVYASPDVMVIELGEHAPAVGKRRSYRIGQDGPVPFLTTEVLSFRTFQQGDLTYKPEVYARLGVHEYILADVTGEFLRERLLLKRRQPNGVWLDQRDNDGGITSSLGFRLTIEPDGQIRVIDTASGRRYPRPGEAYAEVLAAEERIRMLEQEVARLRKSP